MVEQISDIYRIGLRRIGTGSRLALASPLLPNVLVAGGFLLAYVALEWVSFIHEHKGVPVTPWNPGLGVAFALLVLRGARYAIVLFAGVLIAETFILQTELAWPVIIAMAALMSACFAAAAIVARRRLQLDAGLTHVRDVLVLLAAGAAAAALSAVLLTVLLLGANELTPADLAQSTLPLLVGDIIGVAVMTPLLLRLNVRWRDLNARTLVPLVPELLLHALVIAGMLWLIVGTQGPQDYKYFSVLFLPVVAAALRHGIDGSCVSLAAIQLGLVALLRFYGYDASVFTEFQVIMLILTMSGLLVGVVVSERQRADHAAQQAAVRLKAMQAEAQQAARLNMVSGMASALAHEINQPMTAARALARSVQEIVRQPKSDVGRVDANLTTLIAQIDHAGGVVRRMREFMRRGQPHFSTLDIRVMLDDALVLARPEASAKRTSIELQVDPQLPTIFGDRIQLQQVVLNLVHNAVESILESGRTDGRIHIGARYIGDASTIEISVADNGVGLAPGLELFNPLTSSKKDGLGLGLSICASIVQAHGGRIWLHSGTPGATEFRFTLPVQQQRTH